MQSFFEDEQIVLKSFHVTFLFYLIPSFSLSRSFLQPSPRFNFFAADFLTRARNGERGRKARGFVHVKHHVYEPRKRKREKAPTTQTSNFPFSLSLSSRFHVHWLLLPWGEKPPLSLSFSLLTTTNVFRKKNRAHCTRLYPLSLSPLDFGVLRKWVLMMKNKREVKRPFSLCSFNRSAARSRRRTFLVFNSSLPISCSLHCRREGEHLVSCMRIPS